MQLCREKPPTILSGGAKVGDERFFTGESFRWVDGDKLQYGARGKVVGPAPPDDDGDVYLSVLFPGNTSHIDILLSEARCRHCPAGALRASPARSQSTPHAPSPVASGPTAPLSPPHRS